MQILFYFKKDNYGTWKHPRRNWVTIDYLLINEHSLKCIRDCGVDVEIECWSDHQLVSMALGHRIDIFVITLILKG
jgi:exonuclease III